MKSLPSQRNRSRHIRALAACRLTTAFVILVGTSGLTGCPQDPAPSSPERTVSFLLELLHDTEPDVKRTAAESLGKIGDPAAATSLIPLVTDRDPLVRETAVRAIGRVHAAATPEITASCISALEDPIESVRRAAAIALGDIEPPTELTAAVPALLSSADVGVRRAAVQALVQIDSTLWAPQLAAALHDPDRDVRQGLVAALGEWAGATANSWLATQLAQDQSPAVRVEAVYRLGKIGGDEAKATLDRVREKDSDRDVGRWARQAREGLRSS